MDFLWFFVSIGIAMECLRRVFKYFVPADVKPKNKDADDLTGPLLNEDGKCLYNCCAPIHGNYEIETGVSTSSDSDDFDEIVSSDEIEEWSETLVDKRKGKQLVEDDRVQEIIGTIYPGGPGRPKLVHFKVSDNYFKVSDNAGAQALRREASAKVHPQLLNATADEAHVAVAVDSSSHDVKQGVDSDRYKITPPLQELMQHGNIPPEGDEIQPIEGQSSHQVVIDMT